MKQYNKIAKLEKQAKKLNDKISKIYKQVRKLKAKDKNKKIINMIGKVYTINHEIGTLYKILSLDDNKKGMNVLRLYYSKGRLDIDKRIYTFDMYFFEQIKEIETEKFDKKIKLIKKRVDELYSKELEK